MDRDVVDWSNLQRQSLFDADDARTGRPKVDAARRALDRLESATELRTELADFDESTWNRLMTDPDWSPDLVLDGTDNFHTRLLLNDLALRQGIPFVHAAAVGAEARAMVIRPGSGPCFRCLLEDVPTNDQDTCETVGVLEPAIALATAFQTTQALKLLGGRDADVTSGLFVADLWEGRFDLLMADATARPGCRSCGTAEYPSLGHARPPLTTLCGRNAVQVRPETERELDLAAVAGRLAKAGLEVEAQPNFLRFRPENASATRVSLFADGRALIVGTNDPLHAKSLYDRYVGS